MQGSRPGILAPVPAPFPGAVALRVFWFAGKCSLFLRTIASLSSAKFSDKLSSKFQNAAGSRSFPGSGIPWHQEQRLLKCVLRTQKIAQGTLHRKDYSYCLSRKMWYSRGKRFLVLEGCFIRGLRVSQGKERMKFSLPACWNKDRWNKTMWFFVVLALQCFVRDLFTHVKMHNPVNLPSETLGDRLRKCW